MKRRRRWSFNLLAGVSLVLCLATIAMWTRSRTRGDSYDYTTSPFEPVQRLFGFSSYDSRFSLFFSTHYKPNLLAWKGVGDQIDLDWGKSGGSETITSHDQWGLWDPPDPYSGESSKLGFSFTWNSWKDQTYREICIPYYFLALVTAPMPLLWARRRRLEAKAKKRRLRGLCQTCGYDLRESKERCPECGEAPLPIDYQQPENKFHRPMLVVAALMTAATIIAVSIYWHIDSRPRPQLQNAVTPETIDSALKPGMSESDVDDIIKLPQANPQYDIPYYSTGQDISKCVPLADGTTLVCKYKDQDPRILLSSTLLRFNDLQPSVPVGLFPAVRLIHLSSSAIGRSFDPTPLIRAVNGLHASGKPAALAALRAYVKLGAQDWVRSWQYNMDVRRATLVAELLFVWPDHEPDLSVGNDGMPEPDLGPNGADWPMFPITIQNDIPFCMVDGYFQNANPPSIEAFLDRCERTGIWRESPLNPTSTPMQAVEALSRSDRWKRRFQDERDSGRALGLVRTQGMLASAPFLTVLRNEDWSYLATVPETVGGVGDKIWNHFLQDELLKQMRWDAQVQQFTVQDP